MIDLIFKHEAEIRLSTFLGSLIILALWERYHPKRQLTANKLKRWINNFALIITSTIIARLVVPTTAIAIAYLVEKNHWGLFNHIEMEGWLKFILTFILLDLIIYFQHLFFHVLPILWRFHRVHHSDQDCDISTGLRFHPVEIILSITLKITAIILLGIPALTVIIFELILNIMAMFTHSNIKINTTFERVLRWFVTTPDMHRVHHSTRENETNSNFTFFISLWDRIFGTYLAAPKDGHSKMIIGLNRFNTPEWTSFKNLLYMPMISSAGGYVINNRDTRNADALEKINTQLKNEIQIKEKKANELILALEKAKQSSESKTKFIANISHELRTPLHGILSFAQFGIQKINKVPDEKLLDYFNNITISGKRLLHLINGLLNQAKLQAGTLEINRVQADLYEALQQCLTEQDPRLKDKDLNIKINIETTSTVAFFDPMLIIQVISNLLSNTIKFSSTNSNIEITINDVSQDDSSKDYLSLAIKDTGLGIPKNELETIFSRFKQSSRTETGAGGTGLGLSISRNIIEAHSGKIWAINNINNKGATFTFTLPIK